jgi:hypothetical protein
MTNPFTSLKEAALEVAIKVFINREIEAFGVVRRLAIDTNKKTIQVELDLKGEPSPISVDIGSYELSEKDGVLRIAFQDMNASREWISAVLVKYVAGQAFRLPNAARLLL